VALGAHHIGQGVRIPGVAFGTGVGVPLPIPRHLPRIDRIHPIPGRDQRGHPGPAVGLDPDQHLLRLELAPGLFGDQLVQPGHPGQALGQPRLALPAPGLVLDLHIVVVFGPVISHVQHACRPSSCNDPLGVAAGGTPAA
jgi:hypothetical protein